MARIRTIKPEFWQSEILGRMSPLARLTYVGLISLADDGGRGRADIQLVCGQVHPYAHPNVLRRVAACMSELSQEDADGIPMVLFYKHGPCSYYWLPTFNNHQRIDKPTASKIPTPPDYERILGVLQERYRTDREGKGSGREGKGGEGEPSPSDSASPGDNSGGASPPGGKPDPVIEELLGVYSFCKTPGDPAKRRAFEDLIRQGVSIDRLRILPERVNVKKRDFFEIIRMLTPSAKGPGAPSGRKKEPVCKHTDTKVVSEKDGDELLECINPTCDHYTLPWRMWRSDLKEQVKK